MTKENEVMFPSKSVTSIKKEVFSSISAKDANKVMDQLFLETMSSEYYDDARYREKVIGTYRAVKIMLFTISNNCSPADALRLGITIDL